MNGRTRKTGPPKRRTRRLRSSMPHSSVPKSRICAASPTSPTKSPPTPKDKELLVSGLEVRIRQSPELGAQRKAVIFTESRRTQAYLFDLLSEHGYQDRIVLMNGTNADPLSAHLSRMAGAPRGTDALSGSATADTQSRHRRGVP